MRHHFSTGLIVFSVALLVCLLSGRQDVCADGCFVWNKGVDIREPSQKAIVLYDEGVEDLILQVKYHGPTKDFGWLIPVPNRPEVEKASIESFYFLSRLTQLRQRYGRQGKEHLDSKKIRVLEFKTVGVYDVATLAAKDGPALEAWLQKHDFNWPDKGREVLRHYVEKMWYFVAVKVNLGRADDPDVANKLQTGELHPLRITFRTPQCTYPLRISSLNKGDCSVDIYMISCKQPYICSDMDFFSAQSTWPLGRYIAGEEQFPETCALVRDLPRLKNRKWYLYKHHELFEPRAMQDLTFVATDADDLSEQGEKYLGAKFGPRLPKLMDNRHRAYAVAAAYHAPKTFERITIQLLKSGDPRSVNWLGQIDWAQAKADAESISRAIAQQWVNAEKEHLRDQYLRYLFHMGENAGAGARIVAEQISRPEVAAERRDALDPIAKFLGKHPDKEATGHLIARFEASRKAHSHLWDEYDLHLVRALGQTRSPEAAVAIGEHLLGRGEVAGTLTNALTEIGSTKAVKPLVRAINKYGLAGETKHLFDALWALDSDAAFRLATEWIDAQRYGQQDDVMARLGEHGLTDDQVAVLCQRKRVSKLPKCATTDSILRRHARRIHKKALEAKKADLEATLKALIAVRKYLWRVRDPEPLDGLISSIAIRLYE